MILQGLLTISTLSLAGLICGLIEHNQKRKFRCTSCGSKLIDVMPDGQLCTILEAYFYDFSIGPVKEGFDGTPQGRDRLTGGFRVFKLYRCDRYNHLNIEFASAEDMVQSRRYIESIKD